MAKFYSYNLKTGKITKHYTKVAFMALAGTDKEFQLKLVIEWNQVIGDHVLSMNKTRFFVPLIYYIDHVKDPLHIVEYSDGDSMFDFDFAMVEQIKALKEQVEELEKRQVKPIAADDRPEVMKSVNPTVKLFTLTIQSKINDPKPVNEKEFVWIKKPAGL